MRFWNFGSSERRGVGAPKVRTSGRLVAAARGVGGLIARRFGSLEVRNLESSKFGNLKVRRPGSLEVRK